MTAAASDLRVDDIGPQSFTDELDALFRTMKIYNMRYHLSIFPSDLVHEWSDQLAGLPAPTSRLAYSKWKAGEAPRRRLYKGPPHRPQLKIIRGGVQ